MREIKFRVWDGVCMRHSWDGWSSEADILSEVWEMAQNDYSAKVMQFTGLLDKTGKEIYEGDIVVDEDYPWFDNKEPNYRGVVEWVYSQWQLIAHCVNPNKSGISDGMNYGLNDNGFDDGENSTWEVIGNIYENPELLEDA
jgi:uncharacterized phage protein (TIGR01671 family)